MFDVRDRVDPVIPPCWEAVFSRFVLLVGGPLNGSPLQWPMSVVRFVISEEESGWYVLSEGGHFGIWKEADDAGE